MAYPPFSLEQAFQQDIDAVTETDDLRFYRKHFLFVNAYRCKHDEKLPEQCIEQGRDVFSQFVHGTKLARQKAFYCLGKCKEDSCYDQCKNDLASTVNELTSKIQPVMNDYLLNFAPH
jgi:hypothetical protein